MGFFDFMQDDYMGYMYVSHEVEKENIASAVAAEYRRTGNTSVPVSSSFELSREDLDDIERMVSNKLFYDKP